MHLFSVFPEIFFLSAFAALFIRVAVGLVLVYCAWDHFKDSASLPRVIGVVELISGALLIAGAWTQVAAIVGGIVLVLYMTQIVRRPIALGTTLLALVMCVTLLVTGAGPLAIDFPF